MGGPRLDGGWADALGSGHLRSGEVNAGGAWALEPTVCFPHLPGKPLMPLCAPR